MNSDIAAGQGDDGSATEASDSVAASGIVVEETAGVERIELAAPPTQGDQDVERLEDEQLRLAAEIAELRRASAARERELEAELKAARDIIASREAELSDQEAQIASLALECSGLRDRLKDLPDHDGDAAPEIPMPSREQDDLVARLKDRLEERGRALALARQEIAALAHEVARLRAGRAPDAPDDTATAAASGSFSRQVLRMLKRGRGHGEGTAASVPSAPGSEVPTVVVDATPQVTEHSGMVVVELPAPSAVAAEALRRGAQRSYALPRPAARPANLRRYLISLDPDYPAIHELSQRRVSVGRSGEADVLLADATVSRLHATLSLEAGATVVEDASSTNGLFVNARRVRRAVLKDGDTVAFGTARYQYRVGPAPGR